MPQVARHRHRAIDCAGVFVKSLRLDSCSEMVVTSTGRNTRGDAATVDARDGILEATGMYSRRVAASPRVFLPQRRGVVHFGTAPSFGTMGSPPARRVAPCQVDQQGCKWSWRRWLRLRGVELRYAHEFVAVVPPGDSGQ